MEQNYLNIPFFESKKFKTNFIQTAVCELKFPILLELEEKPPIEFQKRLKKDYPIYDKIQLESLSLGSEKRERMHQYQMQSVDKKWAVVIKPDSITIKPAAYTRFEDLLEKIAHVSSAIAPAIDSDFYTRVGLRYINFIPFDNGNFSGYINPRLVGPFEDLTFGSLDQYSQIIRGLIEGGRYTFRHGIRPPESENATKGQYYLDYDYFKEIVKTEELSDLLHHFHKYSFSFFYWSLGPKSIKMLGDPVA